MSDESARAGGSAEPIGAGFTEPVDRKGAFPRLEPHHLETLRSVGESVEVESGDVLFREGDEAYDFFVVEEGVVAIVAGYGGDNRVIAVHGPRRFLGELNLLTGQSVLLTAVVRDAGRVLRVPVADLRRIVARDEGLSNVILRAFIQRRSILIEVGTGLRLIGSRFSPDSRRLREFLARNRVPYSWIDLEEDAEAGALVDGLGIPRKDTPVVIWREGDVLRNPSNRDLSMRLGLTATGRAPDLCDVIVVGGGPAGLAAAVYGASEGLYTQAVESIAFGGQASTSSRIENYLGFPAGISGSELAERASFQARKFGARLVVPGEAVGLATAGDHHRVELAGGETVTGRTVIVATGAQYRRPDVEGLDDYEGLGVYYAATQSEAQLCADDPVLIVGGGNSAGQAAVFLAERTARCSILIRRDSLASSMSHYLVDQIEMDERITLEPRTVVRKLHGDGRLESVTVEDLTTGEQREVPARGLFIFIGASPHTDWLRGSVAMDDNCFIRTGRDVLPDELSEFNGSRPLFLETSRPGIFAVGDVHAGSIKRVASAVGEGSMAVRLVHERLTAPI